jgi:hypothetical protein
VSSGKSLRICAWDAPEPSHFKMSQTVMRKAYARLAGTRSWGNGDPG